MWLESLSEGESGSIHRASSTLYVAADAMMTRGGKSKPRGFDKKSLRGETRAKLDQSQVRALDADRRKVVIHRGPRPELAIT